MQLGKINTAMCQTINQVFVYEENCSLVCNNNTHFLASGFAQRCKQSIITFVKFC